MTLDERLAALTTNLELQAREGEVQRQRIEKMGERIMALTHAVEIDAENIRSLARIAGAHEHRLDRIDGGAYWTGGA